MLVFTLRHMIQNSARFHLLETDNKSLSDFFSNPNCIYNKLYKYKYYCHMFIVYDVVIPLK